MSGRLSRRTRGCGISRNDAGKKHKSYAFHEVPPLSSLPPRREAPIDPLSPNHGQVLPEQGQTLPRQVVRHVATVRQPHIPCCSRALSSLRPVSDRSCSAACVPRARQQRRLFPTVRPVPALQGAWPWRAIVGDRDDLSLPQFDSSRARYLRRLRNLAR